MIAVVIGKKFGCFLTLLRGIECAPRQTCNVDVRAGHAPVNLLHRNIIRDPSLNPTIEAVHDYIVGIGGIARRQRFEAVQRVQIAQRPGDKWRQRAGRDQDTRPENGSRSKARFGSACPQAFREQPQEICTDCRQQYSAVGTKQDCCPHRQSAAEPDYETGMRSLASLTHAKPAKRQIES